MSPAGVEELLEWAEQAIRESPQVRLWHPSDARAEAHTLLAQACGGPPRGDRVPAALGEEFRQLVARRVGGEPVPLIVGHTEFLGLDLEVCPGVFLPRPSSGRMVRMAVARLCQSPAPVFVDVASGIGPVALAVARALPRARVEGLDLSPRAVAMARANAQRHGLTNVTFRPSDLLAKLPRDLSGAVDVVSIHPPYFSQDQVAVLPVQARLFEPESSLTDHSSDGLGLVRRLALDVPGWLRPGGWLLVQVGSHLVQAVAGILAGAGLVGASIRPDSVGTGSVIAARRAVRPRRVPGNMSPKDRADGVG